MNVKLLNVKYSPNVGDGLLVDCLEDHLRNGCALSNTSSIDLAGRTGHRNSAVHREKMMWVLESVPAILRPHLARAGLNSKLALGLRSHYRREVHGADSVVIGGGNLLSDHDLNFPVKLAAALGEARRVNARVAIYGCGVASKWSRLGHEILCTALSANPPVIVAVRDEASKNAWDKFFSKAVGANAQVVFDPGVLASTVHRFDLAKGERKTPLVSIGIMSSLAIKYHGFRSLSVDDLVRWYLDLVDQMINRGFEVCMFTNGSPEDRKFADYIWSKLAGHPSVGKMNYADVKVPVDLCRVISMADVVVAFRMHALIAAYSYGKPFVALKWDSKVDAFLKSVDLGDNILDVYDSSPKEVADLLDRLMCAGIDEKNICEVIANAQESIESLAAALHTA